MKKDKLSQKLPSPPTTDLPLSDSPKDNNLSQNTGLAQTQSDNETATSGARGETIPAGHQAMTNNSGNNRTDNSANNPQHNNQN